MIHLNIEADDLINEINRLKPRLSPRQISFIKDLCDGKIVATHRAFGRSTAVRYMTAALYKLLEQTDYNRQPDIRYPYYAGEFIKPEWIDNTIRPQMDEISFKREYECNFEYKPDGVYNFTMEKDPDINESDIGELFAQGAT